MADSKFIIVSFRGKAQQSGSQKLDVKICFVLNKEQYIFEHLLVVSHMHTQKRAFQLLLNYESAYLSCTSWVGYRKKPFGASTLSLSTQQYQFNFQKFSGGWEECKERLQETNRKYRTRIFLHDSKLHCQSYKLIKTSKK